MAKVKVITDQGSLDGNLSRVKTLAGVFMSKYRTLTPEQKDEILNDTQTAISAYDPLTATAKDNLIFGGLMIGILMGKAFVDSQK